jgi:hypothetical protein
MRSKRHGRRIARELYEPDRFREEPDDIDRLLSARERDEEHRFSHTGD